MSIPSQLACYLAVADSLVDTDQAMIRRRVVAANPELAGAPLADLLSAADYDGAMHWTDPFHDEHPGLATNTGIEHGLDPATAQHVGRVAVMALALAGDGVPRRTRVELLVRVTARRMTGDVS